MEVSSSKKFRAQPLAESGVTHFIIKSQTVND